MPNTEREWAYPVIQIKSECNTNNVTSVEQFDQICRCCLSAENKICPIFELGFNESNFSDLLHSCTSVYVEKDDMLPKNICYDCIRKVVEFNDFKGQCLSSEDTLKKVLVQQDSIKNANNEIEETTILQQDDKVSSLPDEDTESKVDIYGENLEDITITKDKKPKAKVPLCHRCNATFETIEELNEHRIKEKHGTRKGKICKYCNKTIFCMTNHLRVHTKEKSFQCHICARLFASKYNLRRHIKTHTKNELYKCDICGKEFIRIISFKNHMEQHTSEKKQRTRKLYAGRIYTCSHCGKKFAIQTIYKYHLLTEHAAGTEEDKKNKCDPCKRAFFSSWQLREHQRKVHGEKKFFCNHCDMGISSVAHLQTHQRQHTGEKPYQCPICQKSFPYSNGLKCHLLTHTGEKPFVCEVCNKGFTQSHHMTLHMRLHTGERPHVCSFCGKTFAVKGNLTVHIRTHTGETPYVCDVCGKGYHDSSSLKKHKKSHGVDSN